MAEILFLSHRIPFPPDRGDKVRSHHILKRIARFAPVHVATLADDDRDLAEEKELATLAASHKLLKRSKPLSLAGIEALATSRPVSLAAFHHPALAAYVDEVLATRPITTIYLFSSQMGQYVPPDFQGRLVADFVDVDSAKFEAYAAGKGSIRGWIDSREGRLLRREEIRLAERADVSLFVSPDEAELFRSRMPDDIRSRTDVKTLRNGIDSAFFDPALVEPEERMLASPGPRLIFTGQMDYAPNIAAVRRVVDRILPRIRQVLPGTSFHVVGRNPSQGLLDRHERDGCHVWGRVDDMRPWLKAADAALIPLEIGRGVQNKVLEAMSMSLPVVLTGEAAKGIDPSAYEHFLAVDSDEDLAGATIALLKDSERAYANGRAARQFVMENLSWHSALSSLPELVGFRGCVRDAA